MGNESLFQQILNSGFPSEETCKKWLGSPVLSEEREAFARSGQPEALEHLLQEIEGKDGKSAALALQCLQPFSNMPDVQARLQKRWYSANGFLRGHLLWRIADGESVPPSFKCQMVLWALHSWPEWAESVYSFYSSDPRQIVGPIRDRLEGVKVYADHKKWVVLLCLPLASNQPEAWNLLEFATLSDPFTEGVRRILLELRLMDHFAIR